MNYFQFHIGDYLRDTSHLSLLEHGIYCRLLQTYYTRECGLDDGEAARLIGARSKEERGALETVLNEFFVLEGGVWLHRRCDEEIEKFHDKQSKASRSASARWQKQPTHTERNANAMRTQCEGNAPNNQEPITKNQKEEKTTPSALLPEVTESVLSDWIALRKAKKAPITATAVDGIRREAKKAGLSMQQALETACLRGWVGFKAEWVRDGPQETSYQRSMRERVEQVAPAVARKESGKPHPMEVLDGLTRTNPERGLHQDGSRLRPGLPLEVGGSGHGSGAGGLEARTRRGAEQPGGDPLCLGEPAR